MKILRRAILAAAASGTFLLSQPALAFVWCAGPINHMQIDTNGYLSIDWGWGQIMICNVNVDMTMPSPQSTFGFKSCQSTYSMALTAYSTGQRFWASLPNETTCTGFGPSANFVGNKLIGHFRIDQ